MTINMHGWDWVVLRTNIIAFVQNDDNTILAYFYGMGIPPNVSVSVDAGIVNNDEAVYAQFPNLKDIRKYLQPDIEETYE